MTNVHAVQMHRVHFTVTPIYIITFKNAVPCNMSNILPNKKKLDNNWWTVTTEKKTQMTVGHWTLSIIFSFQSFNEDYGSINENVEWQYSESDSQITTTKYQNLSAGTCFPPASFYNTARIPQINSATD